ncbi:O-antigen ligase family protein [Aliarcobacter skirrowii]|uniref:O-antigen ligase family protein n=3 Tax=Aliarcobacter skirrowii TaxID=28200 RepID=UPI000834DF09|nr:O-antigen ligase family protein [Aliarcobacter skirrowii]MDX4065968.1 O-antigen ligase family protein [Aliarcobacter skirrowii]MDX4068086.1 O-antigen ligase family protein [Aliarcobacter skirrowii]
MKNLALIKNYNLDYSKLINYFIVLYAFSIPISKSLTTISIIFLFLFWILQKDYKRKFDEIKNNYFILILLLFIVYSFVAILWSSDKIFALDYVRKYYHFLIIPIIFTSLNKEYLEKVFSAFLFSMLISEITSYGIFFEIWTKQGISPDDPSPFMNHSNYSIYLAFTIFILLHKVLYSKDKGLKLFYLMFLILSSSNLFLNGGRAGQFAFIIALFIFGFLNIKNRLKAFVSIFIVGIIILVTSYNISPVFKDRFNYFLHDINSMIHKDDYSNSFSLRVALWMTGLEASKENILFGTGIGDEIINAENGINRFNIPPIFGSSDTTNYIDYHSSFIQYLVQLGIVGLIIFILIFYFLVRIKIKNKVYSNLLYIFVVLYILQSTIGLTFHIQKSMIFFTLFTSIFLVISKYEKEVNSRSN